MGKNGAKKKFLPSGIEQMLETKITEHLGYETHSPIVKNSGNNRNDNGKIEFTVPRDRNCEFDPIIDKKYEKTVATIVFYDVIHYKVSDVSKRITPKAAYTYLGIELSGRKDVLCLWIIQTEGSNFLLNILIEFKNRGGT